MDDRPKQQQDEPESAPAPSRNSIGSSEERLRALFAAVPDLIIRMDRDGTFLDYSPSTEFKTFVPPDRFLGARMRELMPPDAVEIITEAIERALEFHSRETVEYRIVQGGEVRFREARITRSGADEVVAVVRDVTRRREMEHSLRDSEKRYRELFEDSQGLICTHDLNGDLLAVNPAAARSLGYERDELIGRNLADLIVQGARHHFPAYLERVRENGEDAGIIHALARTGEERYWTYRNVLLEGEGSAPYVIGHALDVTALKHAEKSARVYEARCSALVQHAPLAMCGTDTDRKVVSANVALLQMLGYETVDELLGRDLSELIVDSNELDRLVAPCLKGASVRELEVSWSCSNGRTIALTSSAWPVMLKDGTVESLGIGALP